ncbi:hypothetical protein OH77DRAFT_1404217 [Trametes cingulata]|nr:hypothetical protein OH77DRAFT_1404217 [Trametes cingulata]
MPLSEFFDHFMQTASEDSAGMLSHRNAFRSVPRSANSAAMIYEPLIAALNRSTKRKSRCPGFVFDNASARSTKPRTLGHMKPHVCCYAAENVEAARSADYAYRCELAFVELFIDVRPHPKDDIFLDPPHDAKPGARARSDPSDDFLASCEDEDLAALLQKMFGEHIAYVVEIFARQFRTWLFTVSMCGSMARFLRWDRSGCIVTEAFDVRERPELFCEFLWRFSQMSDAGRGHDRTAMPGTPEDERLFRDAVRAHVQTQLEIEGTELEKAITEHYAPGHVTILHVLGPDPVATPDAVRRFIVSRPVISPLGTLTGRGTRGFWSVDVQTGHIVFLKDVWRSDSARGQEGTMLERLNHLGVRNVPSFVWHGDVPFFLPDEGETQMTWTDQFWRAPWARKLNGREVDVTQFIHYRLVVGTVGYSLKRFRGTEELLNVTYDVFQAMRDAHSKDSRIHRDISVANVIMVKEPDRAIRRGYLIDWEASCEVDETGEALSPGRAGTWAYMSYKLLLDPRGETKATLQDDMESLLYVVLYCALLWLPHNLSRDRLARLIVCIFDQYERYAGDFRGGAGKVANAAERMFTQEVKFRSAVGPWLETVMDYHLPPPTLRGEYRDYWSNPEYLDTFWREFLDGRTLERDDRVTHDHPRATGKYVLRNDEWRSAKPTLRTLPKRQALEEDLGGRPVVKRPRLDAHGYPPQTAPRRSQRIHAKKTPGAKATRSKGRRHGATCRSS